MFAKRFFAVAVSICTAICTALSCFADGQAVFMQACVSRQTADVFVSGSFDVRNLSCSVSNKASEITQAGRLADMGVTIRTTYLIDCSVSIPGDMREAVKAYLQSAIKNIGENEQFKLVSFGTETSVMQDFTSDRYDLSVAADKLEFNSKQSRIFDSIYNTIPALETLDDDKPCFYHTVVITDGADAAAGGITKEELYIRLQQLAYPIDVVAISKAEQTEPAKDLAALTRISGGTYINLNSASDTSQLYKMLDMSGLTWIRITIPDELLDGSTRQFNITDGNKSLQFDYKLSVYNSDDLSQSGSVISEPENPAASNTEQNSANANVTVNLGDFLGGHTLLILIGAVAAIIIIAAVIIIICVCVTRKKSARGGNNNGANTARAALRNERSTNDLDRTVFISTDETASARLQISIKNVNDPDQNWSLNLSGGITIGRDRGCELFINESSISRRQCMLYVENNMPMISNISQTNITTLNGKKLDTPSQLNADDVIRCGRVALKIVAIYNTSGNYSGDGNMFGDTGTMIQNV